MCRLIIAVVFCFISKGVFSAGDVIISGGKPAGMGYAAVAGTGLWSVCNNPAGMAFTNGFRAGIYAENRFLLPDLTTGTIAITFGSRPGTFGGYVNHFGGALYSELKAAAGYARKFGKRFAAGVLIDYLGIAQAEGYGNKSLVSFEAGMMCRPDDKWSVGVHLLNPVPISITDDKSEKLPVVFRAGFSRVFAKKAEVAAEIESTSHEKSVVRITSSTDPFSCEPVSFQTLRPSQPESDWHSETCISTWDHRGSRYWGTRRRFLWNTI
jgi:hypothetical protein